MQCPICGQEMRRTGTLHDCRNTQCELYAVKMDAYTSGAIRNSLTAAHAAGFKNGVARAADLVQWALDISDDRDELAQAIREMYYAAPTALRPAAPAETDGAK